tara:strand:+ start:7263 stop:7589 length:327 start_codon:yes stop_codon:yes gene_type:complete
MFWKDETCWLTVPDGTIDTMEKQAPVFDAGCSIRVDGIRAIQCPTQEVRDDLMAFFVAAGVECNALDEYATKVVRLDPFFWHRVRLFNDYSPVLNYSQRDIDWKGRAS